MVPYLGIGTEVTNREMVAAFLDLPTHDQFAIARDLGFSYFETQADNTETFTIWFREAKERGQLEQLRTMIERMLP